LIDISDSAAVLIVFEPAPGQLAIELVARDIAHGIYHFGYLFLLIFSVTQPQTEISRELIKQF